MMKRHFLLSVLLAAGLAAAAQNTDEATVATLSSPNKKIIAVLAMPDGRPVLHVTSDGREVVPAISLGLTVNGADLHQNLTVDGVSEQENISEQYTARHGKRSLCTNEARALTVMLAGADGRQIGLELRAYNDGLCFRYKRQSNGQPLTFTEEHTAYTLPHNATRWLQRFVTSYEGDFPLQQGATEQGAWNYPLLAQTSENTFVLITEANNDREYCATHVSNEADRDCYRVAYPFEWEGNGQGSVQPISNDSTWVSPWRVLIVGGLKDIVESTLVEDVSDATQMTNTAWIESGRASWVYWAYNHGTKDYQMCCKYVDLAADMGWEYVLFDWEWDAMTGGGTLEDAARYALSKGIKPLIWYNSGGPHNRVTATPRDRFLTHENRVKELAWLRSLGFVGVKIDFFESDKQSMMQ